MLQMQAELSRDQEPKSGTCPEYYWWVSGTWCMGNTNVGCYLGRLVSRSLNFINVTLLLSWNYRCKNHGTTTFFHLHSPIMFFLFIKFIHYLCQWIKMKYFFCKVRGQLRVHSEIKWVILDLNNSWFNS